jgi:hypothetical protein
MTGVGEGVEGKETSVRVFRDVYFIGMKLGVCGHCKSRQI